MKINRHYLAFVLLSTSAAWSQAADPVVPVVAPTQATDGKTIFQTVCAQCHGNSGEGKVELKSPSIAGMPSWYVHTQFTNFREGRRGHDAADPPSFMMATIAKALQPKQIQAVVEHVEKLPMVVPQGQNREMAEASAQAGLQLGEMRLHHADLPMQVVLQHEVLDRNASRKQARVLPYGFDGGIDKSSRLLPEFGKPLALKRVQAWNLWKNRLQLVDCFNGRGQLCVRKNHAFERIVGLEFTLHILSGSYLLGVCIFHTSHTIYTSILLAIIKIDILKD